jgi:hypothetical protein
MEWLTGLALLPALACAVMMAGMAVAAAVGMRRTQNHTPHDTPEQVRDAERAPQEPVR